VSVAAYLDPWDALRRELDRARRYERPLALIQITPDGDAGGIDSAPRRRRFFGRAQADADALTLLRATLRTGDEVWRVHDRIFVMLPEADHHCAARLVERLRARLAPVIESCDVRMVSFPADGLTAGALLAGLGGHGARKRATAPVARPREVMAAPRAGDDVWQRRSRRSWGPR
jgi:hypothetical protein